MSLPDERRLQVKNWSEFQQYKDRRPPWIKLHHGLLDDAAFHRLSIAARAALPLIWLMASETDGTVSADATVVAWRLRWRVEDLPLDELVDAGFLEPCDAQAAWAPPWPSRYVPEVVRVAVLAKTKGRCAACGSAQTVEIDHIVPVSKGGTSEESNLQPLCRKCNRKKRVRTRNDLRSGGYADQGSCSGVRSLETETEADKEAEGELPAAPAQASDPVEVTAVVVVTPQPPGQLSVPRTWVQDAVAMWNTAFGGKGSYGKIGNGLKEIVLEHSWEIVRSAWARYLGETEPRYASAANFASTFGAWTGTALSIRGSPKLGKTMTALAESDKAFFDAVGKGKT